MGAWDGNETTKNVHPGVLGWDRDWLKSRTIPSHAQPYVSYSYLVNRVSTPKETSNHNGWDGSNWMGSPIQKPKNVMSPHGPSWVKTWDLSVSHYSLCVHIQYICIFYHRHHLIFVAYTITRSIPLLRLLELLCCWLFTSLHFTFN